MKIFFNSKLFVPLVLSVILFLGGFFRLYGLNWDQNQHLQPDERFLTMVTEKIEWPDSFGEYTNPEISTLSPYNNEFTFYVYGTLPLNMVKFFGEFIKFSEFGYTNITLVGRFISAVLDILVIFLVFRITKKVFNQKVGILAAFLYSISVLPIQLSHFYAVDTFLVFFITLSFYESTKLLEAKKILIHSTLLGISLGLAIASKISAILIVPIIILGFGFLLINKIKAKKDFLNSLFLTFFSLLVFMFSSYFTLRLADPRLFSNANFFNFTPNPMFVENIKQLKSFDDPDSLFPPSIQWVKTKPIIFPLKNIVLWGLGLPLGFLVVAGVLYSSYNLIRNMKRINRLNNQQITEFLIFLWILILFSYQGIQFSKAMRYFYPIYPFLTMLAANFYYKIGHTRIKNFLLLTTCYLLLIIWPLSFVQIYSRSHSRVIASQWIYQNIPLGSTISCEHWDDCLPLPLGMNNSQSYKTEVLELYYRDTNEKWVKIDNQLENIDYLIMSSNRLWGSIPKVPEVYPRTSRFYNDLLSEKLQYMKVAEITSYPTIPILNIPIPDDTADESFTVYDHPKVLIYRKK